MLISKKGNQGKLRISKKRKDMICIPQIGIIRKYRDLRRELVWTDMGSNNEIWKAKADDVTDTLSESLIIES